MLCVALTDTALYKRSRQCAQLCYALRCSAELPPELAQSVALPNFPPNWRSRKLYFALMCCALLCQAPRCASAVCIVLCKSLRRSARLRAVQAQSTVRSVMLCVSLPDCVLLWRSRQSALLCSAFLCASSRRTGAVDNNMLDML